MDRRKIIIDIDALMDTRLGAVNLLYGPDKGFELTSSTEYYSRTLYDIDLGTQLLPHSVYLNLMKSASIDVFQSSIRTRMLEFVIEIGAEIFNKNIDIGKSTIVEICINIKNYKFTEEEITTLIYIIRNLTKQNFDITIESYTDTQLSPQWLKLNAAAVIKYDYVDWINKHHQHFISCAPNSEFTVFVPRLMLETIEKAKDKLEDYSDYHSAIKVDIFEASRQVLSQAMQICYLPNALYCADVPTNKNQYMEIKEIKLA